MHIYIPLGRKYTLEQSMMVNKLVARMSHRELPEITSLDPRTENRKGLIYLNTTRNARGQAIAARIPQGPFRRQRSRRHSNGPK